jgi:hypothetical protein
MHHSSYNLNHGLLQCLGKDVGNKTTKSAKNAARDFTRETGPEPEN